MQTTISHDKITTINPATGKAISSYDLTSTQQISQIVADARSAFEKWRKKDILERCDYIRNLEKILKKNQDLYARNITQEMGKPITQSYAEIEKCAWLCNYYSEYAESFLREQIIPTEFRTSLCFIRTPRNSGRYHALEFSILAGHAICDSNVNCWKCSDPKAF